MTDQDEITEWCKLHEEVLKDIRTEAYRSGYHDGEIVGEQSERDTLKRKYNTLMAASINNENPGWVKIADIEFVLKPFDTIIPDVENLQGFPFRSYPKRELSSEPKWVTIADGSDKIWKSISMFELKCLEYAINEGCVGKTDHCPPGHLKELHDSGNNIIDRVRARECTAPHKLDVDTVGTLLNIVEKGCDRLTVLERQAYRKAKFYRYLRGVE